MEKEENLRIVFFDGVCGLCNGFVDFFLPRDLDRNLLFSPLQSDVAATYLPEELRKDLSTLVLYDAGKVYVRSTAVLRSLGYLKGPWKYLKVLLVMPAFIRDFIYRLIAGSRYQLFGKKEQCRLPSPAERERFLS